MNIPRRIESLVNREFERLNGTSATPHSCFFAVAPEKNPPAEDGRGRWRTRLKDERNCAATEKRETNVQREVLSWERGREREKDRTSIMENARRVRNARESLEPLSTTNEARCIAFAIRAVLISPDRLTLGKTLQRSAHAKVSFPRIKVTDSNQMKICGDAILLYCNNR